MQVSAPASGQGRQGGGSVLAAFLLALLVLAWLLQVRPFRRDSLTPWIAGLGLVATLGGLAWHHQGPAKGLSGESGEVRSRPQGERVSRGLDLPASPSRVEYVSPSRASQAPSSSQASGLAPDELPPPKLEPIRRDKAGAISQVDASAQPDQNAVLADLQRRGLMEDVGKLVEAGRYREARSLASDGPSGLAGLSEAARGLASSLLASKVEGAIEARDASLGETLQVYHEQARARIALLARSLARSEAGSAGPAWAIGEGERGQAVRLLASWLAANYRELYEALSSPALPQEEGKARLFARLQDALRQHLQVSDRALQVQGPEWFAILQSELEAWTASEGSWVKDSAAWRLLRADQEQRLVRATLSGLRFAFEPGSKTIEGIEALESWEAWGMALPARWSLAVKRALAGRAQRPVLYEVYVPEGRELEEALRAWWSVWVESTLPAEVVRGWGESLPAHYLQVLDEAWGLMAVDLGYQALKQLLVATRADFSRQPGWRNPEAGEDLAQWAHLHAVSGRSLPLTFFKESLASEHLPETTLGKMRSAALSVWDKAASFLKLRPDRRADAGRLTARDRVTMAAQWQQLTHSAVYDLAQTLSFLRQPKARLYLDELWEDAAPGPSASQLERDLAEMERRTLAGHFIRNLLGVGKLAPVDSQRLRELREAVLREHAVAPLVDPRLGADKQVAELAGKAVAAYLREVRQALLSDPAWQENLRGCALLSEPGVAAALRSEREAMAPPVLVEDPAFFEADREGWRKLPYVHEATCAIQEGWRQQDAMLAIYELCLKVLADDRALTAEELEKMRQAALVPLAPTLGAWLTEHLLRELAKLPRPPSFSEGEETLDSSHVSLSANLTAMSFALQRLKMQDQLVRQMKELERIVAWLDSSRSWGSSHNLYVHALNDYWKLMDWWSIVVPKFQLSIHLQDKIEAAQPRAAKVIEKLQDKWASVFRAMELIEPLDKSDLHNYCGLLIQYEVNLREGRYALVKLYPSLYPPAPLQELSKFILKWDQTKPGAAWYWDEYKRFFIVRQELRDAELIWYKRRLERTKTLAQQLEALLGVPSLGMLKPLLKRHN